jgi:hypothetical protein
MATFRLRDDRMANLMNDCACAHWSKPNASVVVGRSDPAMTLRVNSPFMATLKMRANLAG